MTRPRVLYTDLDGTLLGPGGSLFAGLHGVVTVRAAEAVGALHDAGVALVPVSGRAEVRVREAARLLGADGYIAELGGIRALGDRVVRDQGAYRGLWTAYEAMARSGAAGFLLEAFEHRLEPHAPWAHDGREVSMLFRGQVSLGDVHDHLDAAGYDWLRLHDNGILSRPFPGLAVEEVHVYNLLPRGVSKATAVSADLVDRGVLAEEAVAVGDSASDLALSAHVSEVFLVSGSARSMHPLPSNATVTDASHGEGFAEAVRHVLA